MGTRSEAEAPNHKRKGREDAEAPSTNAQGDHRHSGKRQKYCNDRSTNIAETWNEPESSCIGQYPSRDSDDSDDSDDQTHRMVRSIEETLKGPEKKVYASVKRRIQVFAFHEHPFGLKGSTIAEWWTEAAEKLKDDQPNAKINTTVTKRIKKSASSNLC